jgi:hypothetical protein
VVHWHLSPTGNSFRVICKNVNSAAGWRPRLEMTSLFDSQTPISYKWSLDIFRLSSSVQNLITHFDFWLGNYLWGNYRGNCSPGLKFDLFTFVSYCACPAASIDLLLIWFGCVGKKLWKWSILAVKLPFGEVSTNSPKTQVVTVQPLQPNSFRGAASFELRVTKIGWADLKLFDSIFKLEILIPTPKSGGFGA